MVSRSSLPQSTRGFTIVELMVVVVITAILAVIAAPRFTTLISKQRSKSASYEFAQTLQAARSKAILTRRNVDLRATYTATTGNIWNGAKTGTAIATNVTTADQAKIAKTSFYILETGTVLDNATTGAVNRVTQTTKLSDSVVINANPAIALIRFSPDSSVSTSTAVGTAPTLVVLTADQTFVVTDTGSSDAGYTVTLNRFGGTRVQKN